MTLKQEQTVWNKGLIAKCNQFFGVTPIKRYLFSYRETPKSFSNFISPKFLFLLSVFLPAVGLMIGFSQELSSLKFGIMGIST